MWNNKKQEMSEQDDESWEIRAFQEDTVGNCTWPPCSYTCTFCRREFRSAQALGGHMNVHRRDRARMHDNPHAPSTILIPTQEFLANGGLCFLYSTLPSPNNGNVSIMPTIPRNTTVDPLSLIPSGIVSSMSQSNKSELNSNDNNMHYEDFPIEEELDLELRLGCKLPSRKRVDNP